MVQQKFNSCKILAARSDNRTLLKIIQAFHYFRTENFRVAGMEFFFRSFMWKDIGATDGIFSTPQIIVIYHHDSVVRISMNAANESLALCFTSENSGLLLIQVLWIFLSLAEQIVGQRFETSYNGFLSHPFKFIIHNHPPLSCYRSYEAKKIEHTLTARGSFVITVCIM